MKLKKTIELKGGDFPPIVRVFWNQAPANFKVPTLLSTMVLLSVLCGRLRVKYIYDAELHAILLQVIVVANSSEGKSFNRTLHKRLMRPLLERDEALRREEQKYDELKNTKSKNKDLPPEPISDVRCVQRITLNKLIKRSDMIVRKWGEPLPLAFYCEELSALTEGNKSAYGDLRTLGRLAFDLGSEISSDTCYSGSYNARVDVIWSSLFNCTRDALDQYIGKKGLLGGNAQRIVPVFFPDMMGEEAPIFPPLTAEQQAMIDTTVDNLMLQTYNTDGKSLCPLHDVPMAWLDKDVRSWCKQHREEIAKTGSRALNCFYKRSSVIAFRMAALCYYLWGEDTVRQRNVRRIYWFLADYIVKAQMDCWGMEYEKLLAKQDRGEQKPKPTLYDQIPPQFTRAQLDAKMKDLELTTPVRVMLCLWQKNGLIHKLEDSETEVFEKNF